MAPSWGPRGGTSETVVSDALPRRGSWGVLGPPKDCLGGAGTLLELSWGPFNNRAKAPGRLEPRWQRHDTAPWEAKSGGAFAASSGSPTTGSRAPGRPPCGGAKLEPQAAFPRQGPELQSRSPLSTCGTPPWFQEGPRGSQEGPKGGPKMAPRGPKKQYNTPKHHPRQVWDCHANSLGFPGARWGPKARVDEAFGASGRISWLAARAARARRAGRGKRRLAPTHQA